MLDRGPTPEEFGLAGYVRAVAEAVGIPWEATTWEAGDTLAAYLALDKRSQDCPDDDLMLIWSESGWLIAVERSVCEPTEVLARLDGHVVPAPGAVKQFVADVLDGHCLGGHCLDGHCLGGAQAASLLGSTRELADLLSRYAIADWRLPGPA